MSNFHCVLLLCVCLTAQASSIGAKFKLVDEWNNWKSFHGKDYVSEKQELEKHITWLSNKEYIDQHNANAHIYGFTLGLNHMGDMVRGNRAL